MEDEEILVCGGQGQGPHQWQFVVDGRPRWTAEEDDQGRVDEDQDAVGEEWHRA